MIIGTALHDSQTPLEKIKDKALSNVNTFVEIPPLWKSLQVFGNLFFGGGRGGVFGTILNPNVAKTAIGEFIIFVNGQMYKNDQVIWSYWGQSSKQ